MALSLNYWLHLGLIPDICVMSRPMPVWVKEADELPVIGNNLTKKVLAQKSFVVDPDPTVFLNANVNLGGEMNSDPDPAKK